MQRRHKYRHTHDNILRSIEGARRGKLMEDRVEKILWRIVQEGFLRGYRRHTEGQREDREGKDFTLIGTRDGTDHVFHCGVTTSGPRARRANRRYPRVPQIFIPWEMLEAQIYRRMLMLVMAHCNGTPEVRHACMHQFLHVTDDPLRADTQRRRNSRSHY